MARIALVDDDRNILTSVSMTLEAEGFEVETFNDGQSALDAFNRRMPDMAVLDIMMPRMDGYQASRAIREHERTQGLARVPILAVTAWAMQTDKELCLESGMDEVLTKPLRPKALEAALVRRLHEGVTGGDDLAGDEIEEGVVEQLHAFAASRLHEIRQHRDAALANEVGQGGGLEQDLVHGDAAGAAVGALLAFVTLALG